MNQSTPTKAQRTEPIDHVKMLKKQKIMDRMKQAQFSTLKGSSNLMEKLQRQRSAMKRRQEETDSKNMFQIIQKQQTLVTELNSENLELIQENEELKKHLNNYDLKYRHLLEQNKDLNTQNSSLKYQLLVSQNNCAQSLKELQSARLYINSVTNKDLIK